MKDKILNIIHKKLSDGFKVSFLSRQQFEAEFATNHDSLLTSLKELIQAYYELKNSTRKQDREQIIQISKDEYILSRFNRGQYAEGTYTTKDFKELKERNEYEKYSAAYDTDYEEENDVVISLLDFIKNKTLEFKSSSISPNLSIKYLFWTYFHSSYSGWGGKRYSKHLIDAPEKAFIKFKEDYLSNSYLKLLDVADKNINDENLSGFETFIVNVGKREYEIGRAGWSTNIFHVLNNEKEYTFSYSAKDEKSIKGEFINVFIFQKRHLIKISVTLAEVERTPYIIQRDCEKISLKNECEIVIAKHHGNETIIFDTRKDALAFQSKLIEIREGQKFK